MTYLDPLLDRLAAFEPTTLPVLSLYLNTSSDRHGRDDYASFLRKETKAAGRTFPLRSPERGKRSRRTAAQKRATPRDDVGALPVTGAVVGVFGRGLPRRRPQPRI